MSYYETVEEAIKDCTKGWWYKVPTALKLGQWSVFWKRIKEKYPAQYFFRKTLYRWLDLQCYRVKDLYYEWKCYFNPCNVLYLSLLPKTWSDRDTRLVAANFQLLIDFVEKEDNWVLEDFDLAIAKEIEDGRDPWWYKNNYDNYTKLKNLYWWAKNELPDKINNSDYDEEITEKLIQLIELRCYLWS